MTGSFPARRRTERLEDDPYRRAVVRLDDGSDVAYRDVRRFGTWLLARGTTSSSRLPWHSGSERSRSRRNSRRADSLGRRCGRRAPVKAVLLDQRARRRRREHLRGRGALARADPSAATRRRACDAPEVRALHRAIRRALRDGIGRQGATLRDYRDPNGRSGVDAGRVSGLRPRGLSRAGAAGLRSRGCGSRGAARGSALVPASSTMTAVTAHEPLPPRGRLVGNWTDRDGVDGLHGDPPPGGKRRGLRGARRRARDAGDRPALTRSQRRRVPTRSCSRAAARTGSRRRTASCDWLAERGHRIPDTGGDRAAGRRRGVSTTSGSATPSARPGPERPATRRATLPARDLERGSVGAGTGCTVGKLARPERAGRRAASASQGARSPGGGKVVGARRRERVRRGRRRRRRGPRRASGGDGGYRRTVDLLAAGESPLRPWREATTLVCVLTDAALTKTEAWLVARAASAGVARAVDPSATAVDGDVVYCVATGAYRVDAAHGGRRRGRCRREGDPGWGPAGDRRARLPGSAESGAG